MIDDDNLNEQKQEIEFLENTIKKLKRQANFHIIFIILLLTPFVLLDVRFLCPYFFLLFLLVF